MSAQTIYNSLRSAGLSHAGACGVMGNLYCESLLKSTNVEDRCPESDYDYTANVDAGTKSKNTFIHDAYGYGLAQWTYYSRKAGLYDMAKSKNVSIGDEEMQVQFLLSELNGYASLFSFLKSTDDMYTATSRVCTEFERPAVNNISARYSAAQKYDGLVFDGSASENTETTTEETHEMSGSTESCNVTVRVLQNGDKGRDVYLLQAGINDMGLSGVSCGTADGSYGPNTVRGVNALKATYGLEQNGIADQDVWQIIFQ